MKTAPDDQSSSSMALAVGLDCVDTVNTIDRLVKEGAGEFFAGFVPREWSETFGWEVPLNRRTFGPHSQYTSLGQLEEAIQTVHRHGCRFHVTLNAHDYGAQRLEQVRDIVSQVDRLNPDAYIVADPALMLMLQRWGFDRPMHLSTGAGSFNSESVRFLCDRFPVRRVVIPRKMTLREMGVLMHTLEDLELEFEVMIIGYRCNFNDEHCFSLHCGTANNLCTDFVDTPTQISPRFPANWKDALGAALQAPFEQFEEGSAMDLFAAEIRAATPGHRRESASERTERGMDSRIAVTLYGTCGLCAVPELKRLGVHVLKIPVRGAPWQKLKYLEAVRTVVDHDSPTRAMCRALINSSGFCDRAGNCYYHIEDEAGGRSAPPSEARSYDPDRTPPHGGNG